MASEPENALAGSTIQGMFDALDALLDQKFALAFEPAAALGVGALRSLLEENPVVFRGRIEGGLGVLALLLPVASAAGLATALGASAAADAETLSAVARARLREAAEPVLAGGVRALMQRLQHSDAPLEDVGLLADARAEADDLAAYLGDGLTLARFTFEGGTLSGSGALLLRAKLADLAPQAGAAKEPDSMISDAELGEILSGFGTPSGGPGGALRGGAATRTPGNLDMVLDIRLVATARLGRIEMPIGDILNLGPGSIIELGHLVDEPIELLVNGKLVARGDVVVVDEKFGLRITEIVSQQERIESLR